MTVSFRIGRYLVALLWSWSLPLIVGGAAGSLFTTWQVLEVLKASDELFADALDASIGRVTDACSAPAQEPTSFIDHREQSDPSEDLVSQHWREAASLWVARRAQGGTLIKRRTNVQSEGASKRHGGPLPVMWGSSERARGHPCQALHGCAKAKVHLIFKESLPKAGSRHLTLAAGSQERKGSLPEGPRQTAPPFGLVA